jgi:protein O-GlcNAc transferase
MVFGTPVVTWQGQFARGRNVAAAYLQMKVVDAPIADRMEDYATLVLALGRDPLCRNALSEVLLDAAGRELFCDMYAVREFEFFIEDAIKVAGSGTKLSVDWSPAQ